MNYYYDTNPFVNFSQNAQGRLTAVQFYSEDTGREQLLCMYSYNTAGRVTGQRMTIVPTTGTYTNLNASYTWDNQGRMTSVTYPNYHPLPNGADMPYPGPVYTMQYDAMGNLGTMLQNVCTETNDSGECLQFDQGGRLAPATITQGS